MLEPGGSSFGRLLQEHRRAAGLSQQELAERAGLSLRGIADLERGVRRSPYPATVRRLVEALGLDDAERAALFAAGQPDTPGSGPAQFEPTRSLPLPLSSFVGREDAITTVQHLLKTARLLTLTGTGGIGKTRLALEVARGSPNAIFVDLAPLVDGGLVPAAVAGALGIREQPNVSLQELLITYIGGRDLLLMLDNCEHLIVACAVLAEHLLRSCPNLRILATSREPLGVAGEQLWPVPPLAVTGPIGSDPTTAEAVRLFAERARLVRPDFELNQHTTPAVVEVCRRLDGMPLALELAAAQVLLLSIEQIATRLDHALGLLTRGRRLGPARHRTVRATLDWSYGLLAAPEQLLFKHLAVFVGGWTLEAAEAIATVDDLEPSATLSVLGSLVDKSLVVVEHETEGLVRYRFLETVRQYALERLVASGDMPRARDRHAEHVLAVVEHAETAMTGRLQAATRSHLEREHDNCRAALRWFIERGDANSAQRLGAALALFWFFQGHLSEGRAWLAELLGLADASRTLRARLLYGSGLLAQFQGDYTVAQAGLQESLGLWREQNDRRQIIRTLQLLGQLAWMRGDIAGARAALHEALDLVQTVSDPPLEALIRRGLGDVALDTGELASARGYAQHALAMAQDAGALTTVCQALRILGEVSHREGDLDSARELLEASLSAGRRVGDGFWVASVLLRLAHVALDQGQAPEAATLLTQSLVLFRELGDRPSLARSLVGLARVAAAQRRFEPSLQFAAAAEVLAQSGGFELDLDSRARRKHDQALARAALGQRAAARAWTAGQALSLDQMMELASRLAQQLANPHLLTPREREVAMLVARGLSNHRIAQQLTISEKTAAKHVARILDKLALDSRAQLAARAAELGLKTPEVALAVG